MFQKMLQGGSGGEIAEPTDIIKIENTPTANPVIVSNAKVGAYYIVNVHRAWGSTKSVITTFQGADIINKYENGQRPVTSGYYYSSDMYIIKATSTTIVANLVMASFGLQIVPLE